MRRFWTSRVITATVESELIKLISFLAHEPTPEDPKPGLSLSYSETVGALYGLYKDNAFEASFSTERDRLVEELTTMFTSSSIEMRPERPGEASEIFVFGVPGILPGGDELRSDNAAMYLLVPLRPPAPEGESADAGDGRQEGRPEKSP